jgi:hypothetical protein
MRLKTIIRKLRAGKHPRELGSKLRNIYKGMYQRGEVYRVGDYVIKLGHKGSEHHRLPLKSAVRRVLRTLGLTVSPTYRAGKWVVQPYYKPVNGEQERDINNYEYPEIRGKFLDLHSHNVGIDLKTGQLVLFDW